MLEAVILTPVVLLALVFLIGAARVANAHQVVDDAAGNAARAASLARSSAAAATAARQSATASLSGRGVSCSPDTVTVDLSNWHAGGSVGVTVSCTVQLSDLGDPVLAGTRTISAQAASVIDLYRQVSP